ncbi:MAG: DEAD/DEAH box helicase family protein [Caldilineaceae bacterium]|nr:DEAD/DEAH box helicase family protein [Caldilineaceae bacterium]
MVERVFVALDLETTGLDARSDAIIEVGAVRFAFDKRADTFACRILDRFVTFVNPLRPIPLRIQQLTGIRDSDLAGAPSIERVIPELLAFVRADVEAVIAHNAGFDFGFLQAVGVDFHRPTQDTFELASILLPGMTSYSLGELCRTLNISLPDAHRARDDAEATARLFTHLLLTAEKLPAWIGTTLAKCANEGSWAPLSLLAPALSLSDALEPPPVTVPSPLWDTIPESLLVDQGPPLQAVPESEIENALSEGGALAQLLGATFERRQGQLDMANRVLCALNNGDHLLIEAGTGTGKSIGYALPAVLWSLANQRRVVIATNTIALQEQLLEKDLPVVHALMRASGHPHFHAALLKGRSHYLCTRRLYSWYQNRRLPSVELRVLAKILVWLCHTETGDVSELFLPTQAERLVWTRLCSDASTCSPERCGSGSGAFVDFFHVARQGAEAAHILVVNHALLLADIASGGRVLPTYSHLVVDEAHHLEDAATEQLSYRVDWAAAIAVMQRLHAGADLYQGIMQGIWSQDDDAALHRLRQLAQELNSATAGLRSFTQTVLHFAQHQDSVRHDFSYAQRVGLDMNTRTQPAWTEIEIQWDAASHTLRNAIGKMSTLVQYLHEKQWWMQEPFAALLHDLQGASEYLTTFFTWLDRIIFQSPDNDANDVVTWMEVNEGVTEVSLVAAPLFVNETLETELVHRKRSVIFTGATLRTGSGFSFIRDRLGLWDVTASTVDSPFDYRKSTLLYLPSDLPEPNQSHFQQAVDQAIIKAAVASSGATLALFTSYAQLRATAESIRAPLDRLGITVLQHGTSSRQRLLREYREADKAVLLGTRSFWEGIDFPGDELRCLLIVRLPFAVPSDPLVAARSAELDNAFRDYTLPDAILRFRQGFGRLIRRATDRGVVVVLDSRVWRKEYGQAFLESLPECTTRHAPLANLDAEISRWLKGAPAAERVHN